MIAARGMSPSTPGASSGSPSIAYLVRVRVRVRIRVRVRVSGSPSKAYMSSGATRFSATTGGAPD